MFGLGLGRMGLVGDLGFAIRRALFGDGEQGLWYDLNDDATIFQDSAGTTLASWGDPVGLTLDKSRWDGRGVVNRLIHTNDVTQAIWTKDRVTASGANTIVETIDNNTHIIRQAASFVSGVTYTQTMSLRKGVLANAPDVMQIALSDAAFGATQFATVNVLTGAVVNTAGGAVCTALGADPDNAGSFRFSYTATATATTSGPAAVLAFCNNNPSAARIPAYIGSTNADVRVYKLQLEQSATATAYQANGASVGGAGNHAIQSTAGSRPIRGRMPKAGIRNLLTATATLATQNVTTTNVQHTLSFTGTGTVTLSGTSTAGPLVGTGVNDRVSLTFTPTAGTLTLTVTGSVTLAQLQTGAAFDAYQAVGVTSFDITESGQPSCGYLSFNGSNQWMQTAAAVNFSATDEMSVFAGVRKVSDAARGTVVELGIGEVRLRAPNTNAATNYSYVSTGTLAREAVATPFVAPITNVVTGLSKVAGDTCLIRVNGAQAGSDTGDQGTGNYTNAIVYFGARAGSSIFFNGLMFSTIIRGALTSGTLLTRTEQYVARQTPTVNL